MKIKISFILFQILVFESFCHADTFTDMIQDLAMQTACLGCYSNTEAGYSNIQDPHDYYTPQFLAKRFAEMSGNRTRTQTFYGVCFDYAEAAWNGIKQNQNDYNRKGMKNQEWYIAVSDNNPKVIKLYDPVPENRVRWNGYGYVDSRDGRYVILMNGVYCKERRSLSVYAHDGATNHAWLWIQRNNGSWYWIDPTWTDNLGYVVCGYVSGGKEVQAPPSKKYCVVNPSGKGDFDFGGGGGYRPTPSWSFPSFDFDLNKRNEDGLFERIYSAGVAIELEKEDDADDFYCSFSCEQGDKYRFPKFYQLDFYNHDNNHTILFSADLGLQLLFVTLYGGGGVGWTSSNFCGLEDFSLAWKVNCGIRATVGVAVRWDIAYVKGHGAIYGVIFGFWPRKEK